ncbi:MAG: FHA domain-containing protein, partial [Chloroflexi bacterium]|nr:FHA domain-containing protein [Chloroflexota bacterium]
GQDGQVYSTAQYPGIVYAAKLPDLMQLLLAALVAAPIVVFVIVAIVLGLVGFLMFSSSREKSLSGTPVLQGRLGGKLSGGRVSSGPVIPVATEEPIPQRGQTPAASPSPARSVSQPQQPVVVQPVVPPRAKQQPIETVLSVNAITPDSGETMLSAGSAAPRAMLTVISAGSGQASQGQIILNQFPFVIGRTEGGLIISDLNVSRRHAQIMYNETSRTYTISDLKSSNGTRINNQRLEPDRPAQLLNGSLIGLGANVILRFEIS